MTYITTSQVSQRAVAADPLRALPTATPELPLTRLARRPTRCGLDKYLDYDMISNWTDMKDHGC
jgi:hypothetical protein